MEIRRSLMTEPLYINQLKLFAAEETERTRNICEDLFGPTWRLRKQALQSQVMICNSWYPRFGIDNTCRHQQSLIDVDLNIDTSKLSACQQLTFSDVTDARCNQLAESVFDRPWLISWSGGVDSTVIVAAVIKNLSADQRKNVMVVCDASSVWESPLFFYQHILPNFSVLDSTEFYQKYDYYRNKFYIIDGEPADCLWGSRHHPYLGELSLADWRQHQSTLVEYVNHTIKDSFAAKWLVEDLVGANIRNSGWPVKTVAQWFWWVNFNFIYADTVMRKAYQSNIPLDEYDDFYINWYHSQAYNVWSIQQQLDNNRDFDPSNYKLDAKKYVTELFKNKYWQIFKTKGSSGSRTTLKENFWIAVQENQKFCYDVDNLT